MPQMIPVFRADLANSKGLEHLRADRDGAKSQDDPGDGPSAGPKKARSSREVLRNVLDGVVDPEILDSCVEDLQIITTHSGNELCDLVQASQNLRDATEAASATGTFSGEPVSQVMAHLEKLDESKGLNSDGGTFAVPRVVSTIIPTDGTFGFNFVSNPKRNLFLVSIQPIQQLGLNPCSNHCARTMQFGAGRLCPAVFAFWPTHHHLDLALELPTIQ